MGSFQFHAKDEADTQRLASALAAALAPGSVVALNGTLGAGKTRLVQGFARAVGCDAESVVSPTFVLIQEYNGPRPIYHFDTYRIVDDDEFLELGPDEYFESDGYTFLEWADRVANCLPRALLRIDIAVTGDTSRQFTVAAQGADYETAVAQMAAELGADEPPGA